ncbi:Inner membrane protein YhjD [Arsenophonus endosymbiont of Bemisia tabaci Q2]|nr:Inner membrane protein YhjD [Arsenophonus endosymbiont of Bemisia tabaci Q2]
MLKNNFEQMIAMQPKERKKVKNTLSKSLVSGKKGLTYSKKWVDVICNIPLIAHLIRAAERFNDRMGNQFGGAIAKRLNFDYTILSANKISV